LLTHQEHLSFKTLHFLPWRRSESHCESEPCGFETFMNHYAVGGTRGVRGAGKMQLHLLHGPRFRFSPLNLSVHPLLMSNDITGSPLHCVRFTAEHLFFPLIFNLPPVHLLTLEKIGITQFSQVQIWNWLFVFI
jgi:hypothetical protein